MPITVNGPGGVTINFPDGTDSATIDGAMRQHFGGAPAPTAAPKTADLVGAKGAVAPLGGDVMNSLATGAAKGTISLAGLPGDLAELGARGIDRATQFVGSKVGVPVAPRADQAPRFGSTDIGDAVKSVTGDFYEPQTRGGRYAETVGEFAPGLLGGPAGLARRALTNVIAPGVASEAAGEATKGTNAEPYARVAAAMAAGLAPSLLGRAITPIPASPARQRLVDILHDEGVTSLTAGQRTGSEPLRYAESALGSTPGAGGPTGRIVREGLDQFTEAAMRRAGTGPTATPEVLANNQRRLGDTFEDLSARNTLNLDPQFGHDIQGVVRDYASTLPTEQRQRVFNVISDLANQGTRIPGDVYQTTRSRLSRVANSSRMSDPEFSGAMRGIRNALDDAMSRSISPADQDAWQAARREYGSQKVLEKTASRAGEATAEGQIVPANLRNTVATENRGAYARGEGPFSELARAGSGVMASMPQSGTAPRAAMHAIASLIGGGLGTVGAPGVGTGIGAATGAVLGPALAGRALMSRPAQAYLGNQLMTPALRNLDPRQAAIINALMSAQQQRLEAPR